MNREELEKKAKELGLEFDDNTSDEDLDKMIKDSESKKTRDPEWLEKELNKVIKQRDTVKDDLRKVKSKMDNLVDKKTLDEKDSEVNTLKEQLSELETFKKEVEEERRKAEEEKMSEVDKLKAQMNKLQEEKEKAVEETKNSIRSEFSETLDEMKQQTEKQKNEINTLRSHRLENDVIKAAGKNGALNPEHIFRMVKSDFEYDPDLSRFVKYNKDDKGKVKTMQDVDEYVKEFLEREENNYLVGTGNKAAPSTETKKSDTKARTPGESKYDPNDPEIQRKAARESMEPEDFISVLEKRDEKKKAIDEQRKSRQA